MGCGYSLVHNRDTGLTTESDFSPTGLMRSPTSAADIDARNYSPSVKQMIKANRFTSSTGLFNDKYTLGKKIAKGGFAVGTGQGKQ